MNHKRKRLYDLEPRPALRISHAERKRIREAWNALKVRRSRMIRELAGT